MRDFRFDAQFDQLSVCLKCRLVRFRIRLDSGGQLLLLFILRETLYDVEYSTECQLLCDGLLWSRTSAFDWCQLTFSGENGSMWITISLLFSVSVEWMTIFSKLIEKITKGSNSIHLRRQGVFMLNTKVPQYLNGIIAINGGGSLRGLWTNWWCCHLLRQFIGKILLLLQLS